MARGTWWHPPWYHVAGVARTHRHRRFAWQAWHLWYWVARLHLVTSTLISRGRRGTNSQPPSFCVAGVALMVLGGALGLDLGARDARDAAPLLRGRRGTWWYPPWFHVAGVAQSHIHGRFAWQAWHLVTSTLISRGRRGTYGTGWRAWSWFRRPWRPWRRATSAWQAWHLVTSPLISRGRLGTIAHPRPRYNLWSSLLEEVDLWGYPVL